MRERTWIGWIEYVDLPDWGVTRLRAKADTGARTSALHVDKIRPRSRGRVSFEVVLHREHRDRHVPVVAHVSRRARVRSSNGTLEDRYFVETTLVLGGVEKRIEISLVDRSSMNHRMLLGRTALSGDFVVDVSRRYLLGRGRRRRTHASG